MKCEYCKSEEIRYTVKLVATNRPAEYTYPKYIPMVKAVCNSCGKYIKFAQQTPELIEKLNRYLETQVFVDRFTKKHENESQESFDNWLNK